MQSSEYLYPPPKKSDKDIIALVVEKTGDITRTSMRQSEIYAYSSFIRIRDGYMVMPKYYWTSFNQGDWFLTKPQYALGRDEEQRDERELTDIRKIEKRDYAKYKIPATGVDNSIVKIKCLFMLCPDYIQNRETSNSYGSYKKLLLMNIGQGFVTNRNRDLRELVQDCVYLGVFEFRAKDNGACNFGHRSRLRDHTNHVLERDAMWELTKKIRAADSGELDQMNDWLKEVRKDAEEFFHELKQQGAYEMRSRSSSRPLLNRSSADSSVADVTLRHSRRSLSSTRINMSFKSQSKPTEDLISQNQTLISHPDDSDCVRMFNSVQELEEHRKKTIVYIRIRQENGEVVEKWFDNETKQSSPDNDILYFKFDARYKVAEYPRSASRATSLTARNRTMSESSIRTMGQPVATSTPCPSPPPSPIQSPAASRRSFEDSQYRTIQTDEDEIADGDGNEVEELNQTSNTTLMLQDNNANPIYKTPYIRR